MRWIDVHSKHVYRATTDLQRRVYDPRLALIETYEAGPARLSSPPRGESLCDSLPVDEDHRNSTGVLKRRAAFIPRGLIENIGKESNELRQMPGLIQDEDEVVQVDLRPQRRAIRSLSRTFARIKARPIVAHASRRAYGRDDTARTQYSHPREPKTIAPSDHYLLSRPSGPNF